MPLPCLILAGGLGTRMQPYTHNAPKAMAPVLGRPFVDWQLELLARQRIDRVVISVGHLGAVLANHVGDGSRYGLQITVVDEGQRLRGTGGAIRLAVDEDVLAEEFFVLFGDSYLRVDMATVEAAWRQSDADALMTVYRNEGKWDSANVVVEGDRVVLYDKSQPPSQVTAMRWIDYGLSVLTAPTVRRAIPAGESADLAALMRQLSIGGELAAFEVHERFYEAGSPAGLADLENFLRAQPAEDGRDASPRRGPRP